MVKGRKALAWEYIVGAVVLVVILFVLLPLFSPLEAATTSAGIDAACKQSLDSINMIRAIGGKMSDNLGYERVVKCSTEYLDTHKSGSSLTMEFADLIYGCYNIYGKSKHLFDQSTGTYCIICKSVKVTSRAESVENLIDFMKTRSAPGKEMTYEDAIEGSIPPAADFRFNDYELPPTGKSTAVIATFGTEGFRGHHIVYNSDTGIGFLIHPYDNLAELGCYRLEGKTTELELVKE